MRFPGICFAKLHPIILLVGDRISDLPCTIKTRKVTCDEEALVSVGKSAGEGLTVYMGAGEDRHEWVKQIKEKVACTGGGAYPASGANVGKCQSRIWRR